MKLAKALKKMGLVSLSALAFNFAANACINGSIHKKQTTLKNQISQIRQADIKNSQLDSILKEFEEVPEHNFKLLQPFWNLCSTWDLLDNRLKQLPLILKKHANRHVHIGYAFEGQSKDDFISELNQANLSLIKYGISLDVKENVEVNLPESFSLYELKHGIKGSFDKPHDYYFVWTSSDYSNGSNDYAANALTTQRVCLIDSDFPEESLDKLITQEVLRLFTDASNATAQNDKDTNYFTPVDEEKVINNLAKVFRDADYQLGVNLEKHRTVTVNVGLDGVTQEYAQELFSSVSKEYEKEFNVSFQPIGFYEHKLPESWGMYKELRKLKGEVSQRSDIYVLLTSRDWSNEENESSYSVVGEALISYGYVWSETEVDTKRVIITIAHEIGHLFGAEHVYRKNAVMHPHLVQYLNWTPKTKETILKNKFKNWDG